MKALSLNALLNRAIGTPNDQLDMFTFVFSQMRDNKVEMTTHLDARFFEYAVLADKSQVANSTLMKLTKDLNASLSPVDPRFLKTFFEQSVKNDNIDGVAHLVNYSGRYGVDLS